METTEGLQLERQYSVKAPWAHMYLPERKIGNVQDNILATSIPSASQIQAGPHHMFFGELCWEDPQELKQGSVPPVARNGLYFPNTQLNQSREKPEDKGKISGGEEVMLEVGLD